MSSNIASKRLIIFDVDGTLVQTKSGATFRKSEDDWQWLPGRLERLAELRKQGIHIAIASNQGGVAFGYLDKRDTYRELASMMHQAELPLEGLNICFFHPQATREIYRVESNLRKPGPGMLYAAMGTFNVEAQDTLMVGDRPEDEGAAKAAGVDFCWAAQFFGGNTMVDCANYPDCHHSGVHRCPGCGRYFCEACYVLFLDVLPYGAVNGTYPRLPAPICPQCHYARFGQAHEGQAR